MTIEDIKQISVLGAGIMGHGIAQSFLMGGYPVCLYDIEEKVLETAKAHIGNNLNLFFQTGLIREQEIDASLDRLSTTLDLKTASEETDFIVEAVPEVLSIKQAVFESVASFCRNDTILASNTSSLTMRDIGARVHGKERLITTHWFNPPHIVPVVEVVRSDETSPATMDTTYRLLEQIKKLPVRINKEIPGFLVNRIQIALAREVLDLYDKGVASCEDIDRAVRGSIGFRLASIGPLLTMDLGGIRLWLSVYENLISDIQSSTDSPDALKRLAAEGCDGVKSGRGFYDYRLDFSQSDLDKAIQKRDEEFLNRLKNLYWKEE